MSNKKSFFIHEAAYDDEKSKRAHEEQQLKDFLSLFGMAKQMQGREHVNKSLEERFVDILKAFQKLRGAGRIEKEHAYHEIFYAVETIADEKIKDSAKINELYAKLNELERSYGLKKDEYFLLKDAPPDVRALQIECDHACDEILADTLKEFEEIELAHLFLNDKEEFDRIMNIGNEQRIEYDKNRNKERELH